MASSSPLGCRNCAERSKAEEACPRFSREPIRHDWREREVEREVERERESRVREVSR